MAEEKKVAEEEKEIEEVRAALPMKSIITVEVGHDNRANIRVVGTATVFEVIQVLLGAVQTIFAKEIASKASPILQAVPKIIKP